MKLLEDKNNLVMTTANEKYIQIFGKKYIGILERHGKYDDAYVYAQEYISKYPDDKAVKDEIAFLETRIIGQNRKEYIMAQLYDIDEEKERLILVGVSTSEKDDTEQSLEELEESFEA